MITKKIYYQKDYQQTFKGKVVSCKKDKSYYWVVLDQTAFYPEGGGQPADTGWLGESYVSDVFEKEEIIYHQVDKPLEIGLEVEGKINFERRFDFMQQHTGEHMLSGLIHERYGYNNVGFHMNTEYTTCDFDGPITKEQLQELEEIINEGIYKNKEVCCTIYNENEALNLKYRSKLDLKGQIRVVTVPDYDTCACCGLHVQRTGEIGIVKVVNSERHRGGTRVTLLCGKRALLDYQSKQEVVIRVGQQLSVKLENIPSSIGKLQEELSKYKFETTMLRNERLKDKAQTYLKQDTAGIFIYEEDLQGDTARKLCILLGEKTEKPILVIGGKRECLRYALSGTSKEITSLNERLTKEFMGKGGGKAGLYQGNIKGEIESIRTFYLQAIKDR